MSRVKNIEIKPIKRSGANKIIKRYHYSGTVVKNSQINLGVFLDGKCGGALQFGPSMKQKNMLNLVDGSEMGDFLELNRMATAEWMPKNTESRALSVSLKLIKSRNPQIKWIISFADATQSGDGAIYRATGFVLTDIKENCHLLEFPNGNVVNEMSLLLNQDVERPELYGRTVREITNGKCSIKKILEETNAEIKHGYQLRYIYFYDEKTRQKLTVEEIPYEKIDEVGAGMYKGENISYEERNKN